MKYVSKFTKIDKSNKTESLRQLFVGITKSDELYFLDVGRSTAGGYFSITGSTVMKIEEERAMETTIENLEDLYEQGLFDINYINFDYIDEDWFQNALEESNRAYAEDIAQEDADGYPSRLAEELVERGVVSEDDTQEDDFDAEDYIDKFVDDMNNDYDDPIDWFIDTYREEEFKRVLIDERLLDVEELISDMDYSDKMEFFDNSTLTDEVVGKDGDTYLFESLGGGQNRDELNNLKVSFLPESFINQLKKNWDNYHLKELPKADFFPKVNQDEEAILEYYVNNDLETYEKGGQMENVKVKQIVYSQNGEYTLDEYQKLSNKDLMGFAPTSLDEAKNKLFEINDEAIEYEEDIQDIKSVDELADFVYENDLGNIENTYNYSWWGGTRQYIIVNNWGEKFDADSPTMVFMSYHRGGDVRGNYEKYEAFYIDGYFYEDFPIMTDRMTLIVEKDGKSMTADTEDMEGYDLYINESDFDEFEEGDNTNLDEIGEKLGFEAYKYYQVGGTLPTPFGQAGLVGETGAMNEMELFAMGGGLPQGVHQYYANTYNPAYPTPHGYAKGGKTQKSLEPNELQDLGYRHGEDAVRKIPDAIFNQQFFMEYVSAYTKSFYDFANASKDFSVNNYAKGGKVRLEEGYKVYALADSLTKPQKEKLMLTLSEEEKSRFRILVDLGDSEDVALITILVNEEPNQYRLNWLQRQNPSAISSATPYAKGGKTQGDKFQVELHWKGLSKDKTIGKYIITKKTLDELEEQWSHIVSIDVLDNSNKKPISWFELKKELYSKGRDKGLYDKGGKTQGYNDKLDESLGNTKGKRSTKEQNYKDRRNESEAMEKKGGKRKYASVKTMDKGNRSKRKTPMSLAKEIRKEGENWQDAVKRASAMLKKK